MKLIGDFTTTVRKALEEIDPDFMSFLGVVVCGTHSPHDWEEAIEDIQIARENKIPFLGICFGHQLAAIEYARNVLGMKGATSEEFGGTGFNPVVVKKLSSLKVGQYDGETYWNNYEVIPEILVAWVKPDNFITCQFHPEYQSSVDKPHPLLLKFLHHAKHHGKQ